MTADGTPDEPAGDEDSRLLVAARRDPSAFAAFYARNSRRVLAYYYRRILCPHTSAELAAETFAQAYESRHRFKAKGGSATAWLFGIAGNLYREWLRKAVVSDRARQRLRVETPVLLQEDLDRIENLVDLTSMREGLRDGMASLSPRVREAIVLRIVFDLPYVDVAAQLGCSIGAARVRVSRGLDQLLTRLEQTL